MADQQPTTTTPQLTTDDHLCDFEAELRHLRLAKSQSDHGYNWMTLVEQVDMVTALL